MSAMLELACLQQNKSAEGIMIKLYIIEQTFVLNADNPASNTRNTNNKTRPLNL